MTGSPLESAAMQRAATGTGASTGCLIDGSSVAAAMTRQSRSIETRIRFAAAAEKVWDALLFYEQIEQRPPLLLRLLLPLPIRTDGSKFEVGDEARCSYVGGHLLKRITHVDAGRHYGFEVVEQTLALGGGLTLTGGCYTLRALPGGRTEVAIATRYISNRRPGWLWQPIEAAVCHRFHRHLFAAMRRKVEPAVGG